jgi:hypothetical protein
MYYNILFLVNCIRLRRKYYFLNITKPKTFNEKILTLKNKNIKIKARFADKLNLEREISHLGLEVNIPKVIEIFKNKNELLNYDFNLIAGRGFIIKANHGSGMNKIFHSSVLPEKIELLEIGNWFDYDSSLIGREKHYALFDKKVFIEELLDLNIKDYKFHVFNFRRKYIRHSKENFIPFVKDVPLSVMRLSIDMSPYKALSQLRNSQARIRRKDNSVIRNRNK